VALLPIPSARDGKDLVELARRLGTGADDLGGACDSPPTRCGSALAIGAICIAFHFTGSHRGPRSSQSSLEWESALGPFDARPHWGKLSTLESCNDAVAIRASRGAFEQLLDRVVSAAEVPQRLSRRRVQLGECQPTSAPNSALRQMLRLSRGRRRRGRRHLAPTATASVGSVARQVAMSQLGQHVLS